MSNKKENVLVISTVASTIDQFCMKDVCVLQQEYNVHIAANFEQGNNTSKERIEDFKCELNNEGIIHHHINMQRSPLGRNNLKAIKQIRRLLDQYEYKIVHCHTPIAAMLTRIVAKTYRNKGLKVIYTAHGFHFYKGASFINWCIYFPIEYWLSKYTDTLITINEEDYNRASRLFMASEVIYIPGVGIDLNSINSRIINSNRNEKRNELSIPDGKFLIVSVGELNKNKNHEAAIRAIKKLNNPDVTYLICGRGNHDVYLLNLINELGLQGQVKIIGYRKDIVEILNASDLFMFPSFREGLSVALMEAMAIGLPVVCSNIRGNRDLIKHGIGGFLVEPKDVTGYVEAIEQLYSSSSKLKKIGENNKEIIKKFSLDNVITSIRGIYFN